MSVDNGIYILKSKDGYRVVHTQAIDNLFWWWNDGRLYDDAYVEGLEKQGVKNPFHHKGETRSEINPIFLFNCFSKALVLGTEEEAWDEAKRMYKEIMGGDFPIIEYGISFIGGWEGKEFPLGCGKIILFNDELETVEMEMFDDHHITTLHESHLENHYLPLKVGDVVWIELDSLTIRKI